MTNDHIKILAIDDIYDNLIILSALIEEKIPDVEFMTALDGVLGIELAIREKPDIILLDIFMPILDGFEVCRRLKQLPDVEDIPVVFITASREDRELKIKALEVGAEAFLAKPIDSTELIAQIRAMKKIRNGILQKKSEQERLERLVKQRTSQLVASQKEAESAKLAQSKFLANMSHEIRTPLNGIKGMIELTLMTSLSDEQRDNLSVAKASAESLMTILNDILDYTKIEAGRMTVNKKQMKLYDLIRMIKKLYRPIANKKDIDFHVQIDEGVPDRIICDEIRLLQVISNLISNGIKFTDIGHVDLHLLVINEDKGNKQLRFMIRDTGIGISEEKKNKLFKRFSQVDDSTTKHYAGTGLGLVISKNLVKLLGGDLKYNSVYGRGSEFWFDLWVECYEDITEKRQKESMKKVSAKEQKQVLVVDDDLVNQKLMNAYLSKMNVKVSTASNGKEGVDLFAKEVFDIVFMDISMPIMDGFKAVKLMKKNKSERMYCKIIAMTAFALKDDEERVIKGGFDGYISKPIDFKIVNELIKVETSK